MTTHHIRRILANLSIDEACELHGALGEGKTDKRTRRLLRKALRRASAKSSIPE